MIPKVIHYCWFGDGEKSAKMKKCIKSWRKYCLDYKIIEWNETNIDINMNPYTKMCYKEKKYAFLSDYMRLLILYNHGGIYMDTDVEIIRNLDPLLESEAYFGFETDQFINTGIGFGCEKNSKIVKSLLDEYSSLLSGKNGTIGCPILNTEALKKKGLILNGKKQVLEGAVIYPSEYFNPYDDATGRLRKTKNTYSIHWYAKSWMDRGTILRSKITKPFHRILGENCFKKLKRGKAD